MNAEVKYFTKSYHFCKPVKTSSTEQIATVDVSPDCATSSSLQPVLMEYFLHLSIHTDWVARQTNESTLP